jgi:hypothetical protein
VKFYFHLFQSAQVARTIFFIWLKQFLFLGYLILSLFFLKLPITLCSPFISCIVFLCLILYLLWLLFLWFLLWYIHYTEGENHCNNSNQTPIVQYSLSPLSVPLNPLQPST